MCAVLQARGAAAGRLLTADLLKRQSILVHIDANPIALPELALEHPDGQRVEHAPLDGPLQGACAVHRIVPLRDDEVLGGVGQLDMNLAFLEPLEQVPHLDVDDFLHVLEPKRVEEDDFVDPVQELRPEVLPQRFRDLSPDALRKLS